MPVVKDPRVSMQDVRGLGRMFVMDDLSEQKGPTFTVRIRLWSTRDDLQLDVSRIRFWRDPAQRLTPESFMGPFKCNVGLRESELQHRPPTTLELKRGVCATLFVRFYSMPPDPKDSFAMKIDGLSTGGRSVDMPEVTFRYARKTGATALP